MLHRGISPYPAVRRSTATLPRMTSPLRAALPCGKVMDLTMPAGRIGVLMLVVVLLAGGATAHAGQSRIVRINEVLSPYLSKLIDQPSTAKSKSLARTVNRRLDAAVAGAPVGCRRTIRATKRVISNVKLGAKTKRKRILDASAPIYARC